MTSDVNTTKLDVVSHSDSLESNPKASKQIWLQFGCSVGSLLQQCRETLLGEEHRFITVCWQVENRQRLLVSLMTELLQVKFKSNWVT